MFQSDTSHKLQNITDSFNYLLKKNAKGLFPNQMNTVFCVRSEALKHKVKTLLLKPRSHQAQ